MEVMGDIEKSHDGSLILKVYHTMKEWQDIQ